MCACACLFSLIAAGAPRLALLFVWLFTDLVTRAFDHLILPFLGLIFLPWTTLMYVLVYDPGSDVSILGALLVIFGFFLDLGSYLGTGYGGRRTYSSR
jgi:hypothetical protein